MDFSADVHHTNNGIRHDGAAHDATAFASGSSATSTSALASKTASTAQTASPISPAVSIFEEKQDACDEDDTTGSTTPDSSRESPNENTKEGIHGIQTIEKSENIHHEIEEIEQIEKIEQIEHDSTSRAIHSQTEQTASQQTEAVASRKGLQTSASESTNNITTDNVPLVAVSITPGPEEPNPSIFIEEKEDIVEDINVEEDDEDDEDAGDHQFPDISGALMSANMQEEQPESLPQVDEREVAETEGTDADPKTEAAEPKPEPIDTIQELSDNSQIEKEQPPYTDANSSTHTGSFQQEPEINPYIQNSRWGRDEIVYLFQFLDTASPTPRIIEFHDKKKSTILKKSAEIQLIIERVEDINQNMMNVYGEWSIDETATLYWLLFIDLRWGTISEHIPKKDQAQVRGKLLQMRGNTYWTDGEMDLIRKSYRTSADIVTYNLPVRSRSTVLDKLRLYGKKEIADDAAISKNPNLATAKPIVNGNYNTLTATRIQKFLRFTDDLTESGIRKLFPKNSIGEVISKIFEIKPDIKHTKLTKGELNILEALINLLHEELSTTFPCRDIDTIKNQIRIVQKEKSYDSNEVPGVPTSNSSIEIRRNNFKGKVDELLYYAKWFASENFGSRPSRRKRNVIEDLEKLQETATKLVPKKKEVLTEEEIKERRVKWKTAKKAREEKLALRRQVKLEEAERRRQLRELSGFKPPAIKRFNLIEQLQEEAEYFQSVTGNHKLVEAGEVRNRKQTQIFQPEIQVSNRSNDRQKKKALQQQLFKQKRKREKELKQEKALKRRKIAEVLKQKNATKGGKDISDEDMESELEEEDLFSDVEDKEKDTSAEADELVSPYDPYDINTDTLIPLRERKFFNDQIHNFSYQLTPLEELGIQKIDNLASTVICSNTKLYNDLPISFPTFLNSEGDINPLNRVRLRYLLYPEYSEEFVLAAPKSNELDPIVEIQKLFQMHFALYFSHSEKLKNIIIDDYCRPLERSLEDNDFVGFMRVIDKWNTLMLKLTPNVQYRESNSELDDLNFEVRAYLMYDTILEITDNDLKLSTFFEEFNINVFEEESPDFEVVKEKPSNESNIDCKRAHYITNFFTALNSKTSISRFCLQQILLQIYARIVSPDSHKLRSYKAFTAEVYGELLPSFVSEVLTKVDLSPSHKFYDLGSGVGNTTFQAALEFGATVSGGCELMKHASKLTEIQEVALQKKLSVLGIRELPLTWALAQSFVDNPLVSDVIIDCDVIIVNNYLFDANLNADVGRLLYGLKPGSKIISLRNFIRPRYKVEFNKAPTVFDFLKVEKHEMSDFLSVSWTANKVPYYISTVQETICPEYL